ncbi:YafY family protein [Paenibacillus sp. P46E]|uniref:helix-turn-helix transcriptional regulator n=1 Tax=Paenibacillus sp. P46E TaxID=1349436 RepID=UPI0009392CEA|nr:YafY family protein [Paenibacillus sp. P46E]OKP98670.1 transcriptional regulator [Paenibacillus sp. P46E]
MNERRLAMMQIIDSRKKFTARELADRFGVSLRTIQRDLDYLQQIGFPLYAEVGAHGGYRALPNRILPPLRLTPNEALGLFLMLQVMEQIQSFPYESFRTHLAEHYYASLPPDVKDSIDRMRSHIAVLQQQPAQPAPFTTAILQAAIAKKQIAFTYRSRSGTKDVQATPVGIYLENGYWYMPAKKGERVILYRADRILQLEVLEQEDPSAPDLQEWLGAADERPRLEVTLWFTAFGARLAESDPMFHSLQLAELPPGYAYLWKGSVPVEEFPYTARGLLKFGPEVKVVEPPQLQETVIQLLELSLKPYRCLD